jgi:D-alanyl-D-alanine dipeptidase
VAKLARVRHRHSSASLPRRRAHAALAFVAGLAAARSGGAQSAPPPLPPARLAALLGEYGPGDDRRLVLERGGRLVYRALRSGREVVLAERAGGVLRLPGGPDLRVARDSAGRPVALDSAGVRLARRALGPESGAQLRVTPVRPIAELRAEALAATPPAEPGPFRAPDLVELTRLDPTIRLEVRYATADNFLGAPFYTQPRAFLQRPAAQALARVSRALRARGYGLLVHDGYRPWAVTRMFWDATPDSLHWLVANPARGSRHNRGAPSTSRSTTGAPGRPVEMPSTYDESSPRAGPTTRAAPRASGGTGRSCAGHGGGGLRREPRGVVAFRPRRVARVRDPERAVRAVVDPRAGRWRARIGARVRRVAHIWYSTSPTLRRLARDRPPARAAAHACPRFRTSPCPAFRPSRPATRRLRARPADPARAARRPRLVLRPAHRPLGVGLGFRPDAAARGDQATAPARVPPPAARAAAVVGTAARAPAARPATQPPARAR